VWTDHGFMLGEHECWAKNWMPLFEEVSHTPLFIYDPRQPEKAGERRGALVQPALDLGPTLLEAFGVEPTDRMTGKSLGPVLEDDTPVRDAAIFGYHGNRVNITDGRYVYYRLPADGGPLYRYTLMPTNMRGFAPHNGLMRAELAAPFSFTRDMPTLKIPLRDAGEPVDDGQWGDLLFDLEADPQQEQPLDDPEVKRRLCTRMAELMRQVDAPAEQYQRMGLA